MLRWWSGLSMRTIEWLRAIGIMVLVAGVLLGVVLVEGSMRAPADQEDTFDCVLRKHAVLGLKAIHKQKVVASLEHKGARLELWEHPEDSRFSLLWSTMGTVEPVSCFVLSGANWDKPPIDIFKD